MPTYDTFSQPYDAYMNRSTQVSASDGAAKIDTAGSSASPNASGGGVETATKIQSSQVATSSNTQSNGNTETMPVKSHGALNDLWIDTFIKSSNWKPRTQGFWLDGPTGYAEFVNVYVSGNINSTTGNIGGWIIAPGILESAASGARIELNSSKSRVSIFNSTDEVVAMGYLNGLAKHDGTGNWGVNDYGFWAKAGDKLSIDGDGEYTSGDWIVHDNANYLVKDASLNTIIRLGTDNDQKGLFIYDTVGNNIAKYTSEEILVGDTNSNLKYTALNGLTINNRYTAQEDIQPGSPVMLLRNGKISRASATVSGTTNLISDRTIGFIGESVAASGTVLVQQSGVFYNNLSFESQKTNISSGKGLYGTYQRAQTFTPTIAMNITGLNLKFFKVGTVPSDLITVSIKATSAGLPTGADLVSTTFDPASIAAGAGTIINVSFASTALSAGTIYAIVAKTTSGVGGVGDCVAWYRNGASVYASGQYCESTNYGSSWSAITDDLYFEVIGNITSYTPGAFYDISRSYTSETTTISQASRNQTADANLVVEQTFIASETFLSRIYLYLTAGSAGVGVRTLTTKLYDSNSNLLSTINWGITTTVGESLYGFYFDSTFDGNGNRIELVPGETYRLTLTCATANHILISYQDTDVYAGGSLTIASVNYPTKDLAFAVKEVYGNGALTINTSNYSNNNHTPVGIAIDADTILLKPLPRW